MACAMAGELSGGRQRRLKAAGARREIKDIKERSKGPTSPWSQTSKFEENLQRPVQEALGVEKKEEARERSIKTRGPASTLMYVFGLTVRSGPQTEFVTGLERRRERFQTGQGNLQCVLPINRYVDTP